MNHDIPLGRPSIGDDAAIMIRDIIKTGWVTQGPYVARFEKEFAASTGARHAVAVTSATTGLHLVLVCLGIGEGDEVIVPSFTFVATAHAVIHAGATPVFADVAGPDYNIDIADVERRITPKTRAILLVHQFGMPADLAAFRSLCASRGLLLIEDAACAIGSRVNGAVIGDGATPAVFSFHPRKVITTGEGGMIVTSDDALAERLRIGRFHGAVSSTMYQKPFETAVGESFSMPGYNYKMTDIQAAIGIEQLGRVDEFIAERRRLARRYDEAFGSMESVLLPGARDGAQGNYQSYFICLKDHPTRERLLLTLSRNRVMARRSMCAIHSLSYIEERYGKASLPISESLPRIGLFLPLFPGLSETDQDRVIHIVKEGAVS